MNIYRIRVNITDGNCSWHVPSVCLDKLIKPSHQSDGICVCISDHPTQSTKYLPVVEMFCNRPLIFRSVSCIDAWLKVILTLDRIQPIKICHDDVIKWKHFPRYCTFVREIHRWPGTYKGPWHRSVRWINGWVNSRKAGDLRRHHAHYNAIVMADFFSHLMWLQWYYRF